MTGPVRLGIFSAIVATPLMVARPAPDKLPAAGGDITIAPINHATLQLVHGTTVIDVDPVAQGDYSGLPAPTLVLITDIHGDHLDPATIAKLRTPATKIVAPAAAAPKLEGAIVMANGETKTVDGVSIRGRADVQPHARPAGRPALPRQGPRQRLRAHARRQADLHRRRHRGHSRDAGAREHRRRVRPDEPAVHDDAGRGG